MIRAFVVDDERPARENLMGALKRYCPQVKLLGEANGIDKALSDIENLKPDLLFLDVELGSQLVFELIDQLEVKPVIIFVTGHDRYAFKAIKVEALDYLIKPIVPSQLVLAVQKAEGVIQNETLLKSLRNFVQQSPQQKLSIPGKDKYRITNVNDLVYCEADNNYTNFHLHNGEVILVSKTLKAFESQLPDTTFFRVHQSYIVNLNYVTEFLRKENQLLLKNGERIPIAQRRKAELIKVMNNFIMGSARILD